MRSAVVFAFLFASAFFYFSAQGTPAQSRTNQSGTGGIHEVRGRVYLPNGKSVDASFEVELQGAFTSLKVYSDRSGSYSFQNLAPGNYTVIVKGGDEFEDFREYVTIDNEVQTTVRIAPIPKIITVPVYLQFKKDRRDEILRNEVVNAKWANVPKDAMESYNHAIELIKENKPDLAVSELRKAISISPSFAPAYTALGKLFMLTGKLDESIPEFQNAIRYDSNDFDSHLNYGIALLNKLDFPNAQKELTLAAELDKTAVTPRYYLGVVFVQEKDLNAAQKEMEAARDLAGSKGYPLVHRYLGGIYWKKGSIATVNEERRAMYKLAVEELEKYVSQAPQAQDAAQIRSTISQLRQKIG